MSDESSSSNSNSTSEDEAGEIVDQRPSENGQRHEEDGNSTSMSSSSSSDEEEVPGNGEEDHGQGQLEENTGEADNELMGGEEGTVAEEVNHVGEREETAKDEEEDGIFTTIDEGGEEGNGEEDEAGAEETNLNDDEEDEDDVGHGNDEARRVMENMDMSDDEEEEVDQGPVNIQLDIARCKADLGDEGPFFVKLPNFLSIDTKPFDPETYDDELEDEVLDDEGKTRLKLKMENTIRWRTVKDEQGNEKRQSNAKIVRWSDGSMSLYLGNEVFEVDKQRIMDFNHLYIRQGVALQAQSVFSEKLVFRPHSTDTLTHRKVTMNMAEKTSKAQKVRMLANVGDDPNEKKKELIRLEEEKLRAAARREAQQRRVRERPRAMGLTTGFLEGYESDEGAESLAAIKRRYQHAPYGNSGERERSYSDSDDERDRQRNAINEAKIDSEDDEEMETSETEQRQMRQQQTPQQPQRKKIVIEEDEDE